MEIKKRIAILGSTGSIGRQTLEVVDNHRDCFSVEVLTAQNNADLLIEQAIKFQPNAVVITNEAYYAKVQEALNKFDIKVFAGRTSLLDIVSMSSIDMVVVALVGFAGLLPTYQALTAGKAVALANKETLVAGGQLIMQKALEKKSPVLPVDSEHSAIFQCLVGENDNEIEMLTLTASGGPFLGKTRKELSAVKPQQALKHPNWSMGNKVTIDSATLMNKGLEMIEAHWLFGVAPSKIQVIVHPQSIVHSLVHFADGAIKAQLGLPDMKLPIQYALSFPHRLTTPYPRFSFADYAQLHFIQPDTDTFECLAIAYEAIHQGGNMPCVMNAANEEAVLAFLQEKIKFLDIPVIIKKTMENVSLDKSVSMDTLSQTDDYARIRAKEIIETLI